ncbi:MAG: bis(5'-nucleosyl)-tetraphosphatase (symmetrical) YqeK [Peptococcia bacterium]|jgi:predicted HD superfamily hydrolase involved in NAD metabolism
MRMEFEQYCQKIRERLSPDRYAHSLRVVEKALDLAKQSRCSMDVHKLRLAALMHDYAKDMPPQELLSIASEHGLITAEAEKVQPDLLHGAVGAFLCRRDFGLSAADEEILHAIRYHTTGCEKMSLLDKIVYLADLLEPGRTFAGVDELRRICQDDLDAGLLFAFDNTIEYVLAKKLLIHPLTVQARNWHLLAMKKDDSNWVEEWNEYGK